MIFYWLAAWSSVIFTARNFWLWILPLVVGAVQTASGGALHGLVVAVSLHGVARAYRHYRGLP